MNRYLQRRKCYGALFPDTFIDRSTAKITQVIIDGLGMQILRDDKGLITVKQAGSKKDLKTLMKSAAERE